MSKILVPISNGFEEIEAISIIDICRRAALDVMVVALEDIHTIGAHGIIVKADAKIYDVKYSDYDAIVLPGGSKNATTLANDDCVKEILKYFKNEDKLIAAICAAPFALSEAGVLNDNYTCYPGVEKKIRPQGYDKSKKVVVDGNVITSQGPATAVLFALEIVKALKGVSEYEMIKSALLQD